MLSVVAWGRTRGVWLPEFCRTGGLCHESARRLQNGDRRGINHRNRWLCGIATVMQLTGHTYMRGELGAVEVTLRA